MGERGWHQRLVIRQGNKLAARCADIALLEVVETAPNPLAAARAAKGSDYVHAHDGRSVYSGWLAGRLYGIRYAITRRIVRPKKRGWLRQRAYRGADAMVAISAAVAAAVKQQTPEVEPVLVPSAVAGFDVDRDKVDELKARYAGKTLIGHVGLLVHATKGQRTIIEAAHAVVATHPDWHFLLLGSGPEENEFMEAIGDLGNIELTGFVGNVGDYLASFDLFVFPSLDEALGSTLLDAMQVGLPIVATRVGGIPEFVEDGVNGILIEPERADQLVAGIETILGDEALASRMRDANVGKASRYSVAHMADAYEAIYRRGVGL